MVLKNWSIPMKTTDDRENLFLEVQTRYLQFWDARSHFRESGVDNMTGNGARRDSNRATFRLEVSLRAANNIK